jgi:hypothetical protein
MQREVAVCSSEWICAHTATSACAASIPRHRTMLKYPTEIYRIVSSKALDQGEGSQNVLGGERKVLELSKSAEEGQKKGGCC